MSSHLRNYNYMNFSSIKNLFLAGTLFFSTSAIFGQQTNAQTENQLTANLIMPSLEWEISTGEKSTVDFTAGTAFAYRRSGSQSGYALFPVFNAEYRYYYNLNKRMERGRKTSDNSGNYFGAISSITGGNPILGSLTNAADYEVFIGPSWGLQRAYNSGFKWNLSLGAGYGFNDLGDSYFSPYIGAQLGWLINR